MIDFLSAVMLASTSILAPVTVIPHIDSIKALSKQLELIAICGDGSHDTLKLEIIADKGVSVSSFEFSGRNTASLQSLHEWNNLLSPLVDASITDIQCTPNGALVLIGGKAQGNGETQRIVVGFIGEHIYHVSSD